jgi:hypothetical protein
MLWIERLFSHFPINKEKVWQQMLARLGLLFGIWVAGLLAYVADGLMTTYFSDLAVHLPSFVTSFLILFGSFFAKQVGSVISRFSSHAQPGRQGIPEVF